MTTRSPTVTDQEIAESNEIIRAVVGSTVHGLAIDDTDDRDEMGVFIEPPEYVCGLRKIEQWTYRTQPEGHRSGPGDLDLTIYSLRKYVRLAAQGNPSILTLLFAKPKWSVPLADHLFELTPHIVSQQAGHRFLGYMRAQRERLLGLRGQARLPNRPELVEKYGYDTKYAGHLIRLGIQGIELLTTGKLSLPMAEPNRGLVRNIRTGEYSLETVLKQAEYLESMLDGLVNGGRTKLAKYPDYDTINHTLVKMHLDYWESCGLI